MPGALEVIMRSAVSFFVLLVLVRLIGKQQVSEMTFFDYVVGITIGSIASFASVEEKESLFAGLAGMTVWALLAILLGYVGLKSVWLRKVAEGEGTVVIRNGRILEKNLEKLRLSLDDLESELRALQVFDFAEVEFAMFEANGRLSVLKKSQNRPATPHDLGIKTGYEGLPTTLISDGRVIGDGLKSLGLSKAWLAHQLAKKDIIDVQTVAMAQLDTKGRLYVDMRDDRDYYIIEVSE